jgi:hypothetical protein
VEKKKCRNEDRIECILQYHNTSCLLLTLENPELANFWFGIWVIKIDSKIIKWMSKTWLHDTVFTKLQIRSFSVIPKECQDAAVFHKLWLQYQSSRCLILKCTLSKQKMSRNWPKVKLLTDADNHFNKPLVIHNLLWLQCDTFCVVFYGCIHFTSNSFHICSKGSLNHV